SLTGFMDLDFGRELFVSGIDFGDVLQRLIKIWERRVYAVALNMSFWFDYVKMKLVLTDGNIVTNSRVTPSWKEIVSLTVLVKLASYT
nr:hypothetical protein [Tanacetum cinerariifolium]